MSSNALLEKLIQTVVTESHAVSTKLAPLNKSLSDYKGLLLQFQSYNPGFNLTEDLIDPTTTAVPQLSQLTDQVCLIPQRDPKYLTFKDRYYLLFKNSNVMESFLQMTPRANSIILTNDEIRLRLKPLHKTEQFINYYTQIYNTLLDYSLSSSNNQPINTTDIIDQTKLILLHNNTLKPIMDKSLLLWNYQETQKLEDIFWYYDIKNSIQLFNDPNGPITLHYLKFQSIRDRNKFKSNIHGSKLPHSKLLIETL